MHGCKRRKEILITVLILQEVSTGLWRRFFFPLLDSFYSAKMTPEIAFEQNKTKKNMQQ